MTSLKTTDGKNYRLVETGPMNRWHEHILERPAMNLKVPGKLFLRELLGLTGMEVSLNEMAPGGAVPFLHRHATHEELYLFLTGTGEMKIDGETVPVGPGSALRLAPAAVRAWRNTGSAPLTCVVVQANVAPALEPDGEILKKPAGW